MLGLVGRWGVAVLCSGLAAVALTLLGGPAAAEQADRPGEPDLESGGALYQRWCAVCHASDGGGTTAGPAIEEVSVPYLDVTIRTGRMPLADPLRGVRERTFSPAEREAVVHYLTEELDLAGEVPEPRSGNPATGETVYATHCAQCHGAAAGGGVAGDGTFVPAVMGADPVTVAAATREGPFAMPQFSEELISDRELAGLVAFLEEEDHPPADPFRLGELERWVATGVAMLLTAAVVGVCVWTGRHGHEQPASPRRTEQARGEEQP